jgi:hypothetical protein
VGFEDHVDAGDLQAGKSDRQVNQHVVHRQRCGIVLVVQGARLAIAHRAAQQDLPGSLAEGLDLVIPMMEWLERRIGRQQHGPSVVSLRPAVEPVWDVAHEETISCPRHFGGGAHSWMPVLGAKTGQP